MQANQIKIFSILAIAMIILSGLVFASQIGIATQNNIDSTDLASAAVIGMYLTLEGETHGDIHGSVTQAGHENTIWVISYSHAILSPRDPATGLPTGKRQHKPLTITKEIDKSSPILKAVMVNNENLVTFILDFYQPSATGQAMNYYRIELLNAQIAAIHDQGTLQQPNLEVVSFVYQKIIWTWIDGGITSEDDWETPNV